MKGIITTHVKTLPAYNTLKLTLMLRVPVMLRLNTTEARVTLMA